jgi:hypothetical protein
MRQDWRDLTFLHYEVDVAQVQATLPRGFTPDLYEGRAYVGLVPFRMQRVRVGGLPLVPGTADFLETNVRTYVVAPNGMTGVWFYSLDAANGLACAIARATFGLPYFFADMTYRQDSAQRAYGCRRSAFTSLVTVEEVVEPLRVASEGSLDAFLLERYRLFSVRRGRVMTGEVDHAPYEFRTARVLTLFDQLVGSAGFAESGSVVHAAFSPGVNVRIGVPKTLR